ncbi:hypothetical protein MPTK2_8g03040 [Marchantia polymorpha subsp. ruderalis]
MEAMESIWSVSVTRFEDQLARLAPAVTPNKHDVTSSAVSNSVNNRKQSSVHSRSDIDWRSSHQSTNYSRKESSETFVLHRSGWL